MAFVRVSPETQKSKLVRRVLPIEFGVGARCGAPQNTVFDVKLRLRPSMLGAAQSFLVPDTCFDIFFDADTRMLMMKPGSDFRLFHPGGPKTELSPLMLAFPLLAGVKASRLLLPVPNFTAVDGTLSFMIPRVAFVADEPASVPATPLPVMKGATRPRPGFDSVLASVKHDVRRGA